MLQQSTVPTKNYKSYNNKTVTTKTTNFTIIELQILQQKLQILQQKPTNFTTINQNIAKLEKDILRIP